MGGDLRFLGLLYTVQYKAISNKTRKVDYHYIEGPVRTALLPRSLVAPSQEGPADIYIYIYIYI